MKPKFIFNICKGLLFVLSTVAVLFSNPAPASASGDLACICTSQACGNDAIGGDQGDIFTGLTQETVDSSFTTNGNTGWTCIQPAKVRGSGGPKGGYCAGYCGNNGIGADPRFIDLGLSQSTVDKLYGGGKPGNHTGWLCGNYRGTINPEPKKKYKSNPVIASFPANDPGKIPSDLKVTCLSSPDKLDNSPNCPVIAWNEYIYWAFSYDDNRVGMGIVAFEEDGTLVKRWDQTGARYVTKITSDEDAQTLTFWGQANQQIDMDWEELYLMIPPIEGKVPAKVHPAIPEGLKVTCMESPDKLDSSSSCPVIEWNGYTYWSYSYIDNRLGMDIVAYDEEGKVVKQWQETGARYVNNISVDAAAQTITFLGQANKTIVMKWADLALE